VGVVKRREFIKLLAVSPFLGFLRAEEITRGTVSYWSNGQGGWRHYYTVYSGDGAEEWLHDWCRLERRGNYKSVSMWTDALSHKEIRSLASGVLPTSIRRESLVGYWPNCATTPTIPTR